MHDKTFPSATGPREFTIGSTDLVRTATFLSAFGFYPQRLNPVAAEVGRSLYGLDEQADQMILATADLVGGTIRLVHTDHDTGPMVPFEVGPHGFDVFSRDTDLSVGIAARVGGSRAVPVAWEAIEGRPLKEARILAPGEGFAVYALETDDEHRSPSVLDDDPSRQHSNIVMTSWMIPPDLLEEERRFWAEKVGYRELINIDLGEEEMVRLQLQPHPSPMRCVQYVDETFSCKVDLLAYPDEPVVRRDDWPIRSGLHSIAFDVQEIAAAAAAWSVEISDIVEIQEREGVSRAATGVTPGGIRIELRENVA